MDDVAILRRVEHTIQQCRDFNMEFDARTVAEIMTDEDTVSEKYEPLSPERALAFVEYEKAAACALGRLRVDRRSA
jgi:acetyl-CoA carboxylase beta subunit